jgi:protoporphyrinogen oxidase
VLGAGPAGAGAAYRAARAGRRVMVVERAPAPGGAAGSIEVGGMRVDFGSHRLHSSIDPAIAAELRTLLGDDLQTRKRNGRIRLEGRWIAFPLRIADLVRHLPPNFAASAARDAVTKWARKPTDDTFGELLRVGLGPTMCERFYFPYARKLWGREPHEISGEQARRRITAGTAGKLLSRLGPARRDKAFFFYPRRGYGAISEALTEGASAAGAEIRFRAAADLVELGESSVSVRLSTGETARGATLLSTVPVTRLVAMCNPGPPRAVVEGAAALQFRAMLLVYLVLDAERYTPYDAHYLPEPSTPVTRISEPKNYRDGDDPGGTTVLCAEIPCSPEDRLWSAGDDELGNVVVDTLRVADLPEPRVRAVDVRRLPQAYPVYRVGFERDLDALYAWLESWPRVVTFGRQGLFVHDNTHHALAMAWAAVDALTPDGTLDPGAWSAARERFATHVVED